MQPGDPDDAVLARFADEAADSLAALGEALLRLETDPAPDLYSHPAPPGASDGPPPADTTYLLLVATADEEAAVRTATELGARVRRVAEHSAGAFAVAPAPQVATAGPPAAP